MRKLILTAVTVMMTVGCGSQDRTGSDPVYPVNGVITLGGRPLVQADVTFYNAEKNRSAFGRTNDKGEFKLTTFSLNDGAIEGQHAVTVVKIEAALETAPAAATESEAYVPPGLGQSTEPKPPKSEVPDKYGDKATSGLTATVKAEGPNEIKLDLQ